jgi:hypothetical protein
MDAYVLVLWPESQMLMEEDWFYDEAILSNGDEHGSSAYFIPESRIINKDYILTKSEELAKQLESTPEEDAYITSEWESGTSFEGGMNTFESVLNLKLSLQ